MSKAKGFITLVMMIALVMVTGLACVTMMGCSSHKDAASVSKVSFERYKVFGENMDAQDHGVGTVDMQAKTVEYGNAFDEQLITKEISDEQYDKIVKAVTDDEFLALPEQMECAQKDVIGPYTKVTVTYSDGSTFTTGGILPDNDAYNAAYKAITNCVDMSAIAM